MRDTLLSWDSFKVGKKQRKVWQARASCLSWTVWKTRNRIAFRDGILSMQKLKTPFVWHLWSETKLSIKDDPLTLVAFINGVGDGENGCIDGFILCSFEGIFALLLLYSSWSHF